MDVVAQIKSRLSIVDVVSQFLELKPAGRNFKALCPFHADKTPSLIVSPDRDFCWCFACNTGGDIFDFVQKLQNLTFRQSVEFLAEKAGVKLENFSTVKKEERDEILEILEIACEKFEQNFWSNSEAQKIVAARGISDKTLKKFRVGFAENSRENLQKFLTQKGFSHRQMLDAGLIAPKDSGASIDKFRSRICFPFFDKNNRVVGFSGRIVGDGKPKFLNSPETKVFKKSQILFGLNFAAEEIRAKNFTLVVEGQFDALACFDRGFKNVVAASGTAFSEIHAKNLARISPNLTFALDSDAAGQNATERAAKIAIAANLNASVATLPAGCDPDDLLQKNPDEFTVILQNKKDIFDYFLNRVFAESDRKSLSGKRAIFDKIFPLIAAFRENFARDHFLQICSKKMEIDFQSVKIDFVNFLKSNKKFEQKKPEIKNEKSFSAEQFFVGLILVFPDLKTIAAEKLKMEIWPENETKKKLTKIFEKDSEDFWENLPDDEKNFWQKITLLVEEKFGKINEIQRVSEFKKMIAQKNLQNFSAAQKEISENLKTVEAGSEAESELLRRSMEIAKIARSF